MPLHSGDRVVALRDIQEWFKVVVPSGTTGTVVGGGGLGPVYAIPDPSIHYEVRWDNGHTCYVPERNVTLA